MRIKLGVSLLVVLATLVATGPIVSAATRTIQVKDATVTSARRGHASAISLDIINETGSTVWITSVTSPLSPMDMIDYDANLTKANTHMVGVAYLKVRTGRSLRLSLRGEGAMLGAVTAAFKVGSTVPLVLGWHSKSQGATRHLDVTALVVKGPKKLYFGGSPDGSMPGMNMG
ncbi:MAG: copper chaperone PCu(A)C [Acidimicrobiales bacterium]